MMATRHVTHLLTRYVHGQLRPSQRARVMNHVRDCAACRAALVREERLVLDLRREMPVFGQPTTAQLAGVWAAVWQEVQPAHRSRRGGGMVWLPGLSVVLALALALVIALPVLAQSGIRAEAAPLHQVQQPRPVDLASPTPGATETNEAMVRHTGGGYGAATPQATVAYVASPVPMPAVTVSPVGP
ncbi:MAG: zf-HC2 domain-containing protein [Anaerolineae bacterium]|nr:zf-HC2 domain-containing protein [Anaerolineae bacterium]